jgi:GntR family transcriptional regulator
MNKATQDDRKSDRSELVKKHPHLDRPSRTTLTQSTVDALIGAIKEGEFAPGSRLPAENELSEILHVSRTTVREALRILQQNGIILRRRGLGTYVTESPILKTLSDNFGITSMIQQAGLSPSTTFSSIREENAPSSVATALSISEGDPIFVIYRVRCANDEPAVWSIDYLPIRGSMRDDLAGFDANKESIYDYYEEALNIQIVRGIAQLVPKQATRDIAAKLQIKPGEPLMCIKQTDYDRDDHPVMYSIEYHIPDKFLFIVNRIGPHR